MKTKIMILIVALFSVVTTIRAVTYPTQPYVSRSTTVQVTPTAVAPSTEPFRNVGGTAPLPICQSAPRRVELGDDEDECRHLNRDYIEGKWVCHDCGATLGTGGGTPGGGNNDENITPIGDDMLPLLLLALMAAVVIAVRKKQPLS